MIRRYKIGCYRKRGDYVRRRRETKIDYRVSVRKGTSFGAIGVQVVQDVKLMRIDDRVKKRATKRIGDGATP